MIPACRSGQELDSLSSLSPRLRGIVRPPESFTGHALMRAPPGTIGRARGGAPWGCKGRG